ncbi:Phosphoglycerate dehydrogenase [Actinopolymorpha cephalotaxi]|uniref:Phosphoglycerate dehydrogenase n=1 Tax=Actinopolymorpha cephalotaxi TaxID=504797 RepID=A0A1I2YLH3_9ACTN|nr:NAD(P)-dependent oxidoreductase [Actinopolymorpha cephalotaxi]NYH86900.1 phosphoglycerate dehydrogenase-like enzyme [Actinopolymorpha cephalotaxi]SFH26473.1 Phosphoglycerate dehydrogenase [Actinopolymorpha cephalotaxi]
MPDKAKVLLDPHFRTMTEIFSAADRERLHDTAEVVWGRDDPMPPEDAREALAEATAVVCSEWRYGPLPDDTPDLRAVISVSGAFPNQLDYQACRERGIRVLSAAPAFGRQVAELALGLALASCREIAAGDAAMRAGEERWLHAGNASTFMLYDQPVGFVGYGALARSLQPLLAPFGVRISVYDPWLGDGFLRRQGVRPVSLPELLETSRFVFVLAAPSSENHALLSRELLERVRPDAVVVLVSRAHVVDFDALTEFVLAGRFRAAVDVFPDEPLAAAHPIRGARGAVLSAHRAGSVREGMWDIGQMVVDDLEAIVAGLPPRRLLAAEPELVGRVVRP